MIEIKRAILSVSNKKGIDKLKDYDVFSILKL